MAGDDDPKPSGDKDNGDPCYEPFLDEELQNLMSNQNPTLMDFAFSENPIPPPPPPHPVTIATTDIIETGMMNQLSLTIPNCDDGTDDFLVTSVDDDVDLSWELSDIPPEFLYDNYESNTLGEIGANHDNGNNNVCGTGTLEVSTRVFVDNGPNFEAGGGSSAPVAPITPEVSGGILVCTCCNLLRTLIHSNGQEMMRLDFHGGIGYFCHAILEIHRLDGSIEPQYQTIDLKFLSMEDVKRFIEDYLAARAACGYGVVEDTNAGFYQALNANFSDNQPPILSVPPLNDVPMPQAIVPDPALNVPSVPLYVGLRDEPPVSKGKKRRQTPLAIQIKSLLRKISSLKSMLEKTKSAQEKARVEAEIERLERQISEICSEALKNA
ncbi:RWP-RK domain protein [Hirschfeldia incana]|nr:RWP-RK domain protein [Hirschfeldia incana]